MIISIDNALKKTCSILEKYGICGDDAKIIASCLIDSDAYGVSTHGLMVLPSHLKRISENQYNLAPIYRKISGTKAYTVIDADNSIGFLSAKWCMDYAVKMAMKEGMHTIYCRNANTYGAAFLYPLMAAKKRLIGFTCCNSPAAMAPIGGKTKLFGTNPFSFAIPYGNTPIIVDMATSKVAKSKFLQFKNQGKELPEGWALDKNGNPTKDPDEAIQGLVCPMEGYKGYGIALIIDLLAGALSGAAYQNNVGHFYSTSCSSMNVGQTFTVINPKMIFGEDFDSLIDVYVRNIRSSQQISNDTPVNIPGDRKNEFYKNALREGIDLSDDLWEMLNKA